MTTTKKNDKATETTKKPTKTEKRRTDEAVAALTAKMDAQNAEIAALRAKLEQVQSTQENEPKVSVSEPQRVIVEVLGARPNAVIRRDGTSARKASVIEAAPKVPTNFQGVSGGVSIHTEEREAPDGTRQKVLILRKPEFNFFFDKSFSYHMVTKAGKKWPAQKDASGNWYKVIPVSDAELLFHGLSHKKAFGGQTIQVDGKALTLPVSDYSVK